MIDLALLAVLAVVTWLVASEGPWGAAITFISVLIAGLLAMNFFEPLAQFLSLRVLTSFDWRHRWDIIALLGLFAGGVFGLRLLGEKLFPTYAQVPPLMHDLGRWLLGLATGYAVMAIIATSLHTAPLSRDFFGFVPEQRMFFQLGPDRQWLAFTQYVSEKSFRRVRGDGTLAIFDGAQYPAIPSDSQSQVWSSFPIKYAARREEYASGQVSTPSSNVPAPATPASPGSGGGTSGF